MDAEIWSKRQLTYKPTETRAQWYGAYEFWWDVETGQPRVQPRPDLPTLSQTEYELWKKQRATSVEEARAGLELASRAGGWRKQLAAVILVTAEIRAAAIAEKAAVLAQRRQQNQVEARAQRQTEREAHQRARLALKTEVQAAARAQRAAEQEARRQEAQARRQAEREQRAQARQAEQAQTAPERAARRAAQMAAHREKDNARQRAGRAAKRAGRPPRPRKVEPSLPAPVSEWLDLIAMNLSPLTVQTYRWHVSHWIEAGGQLTDTTADLVRYLGQRRAAGIGEQNIKQSLSAMVSLFNHVRAADNPTAPIPWPRIKRRRQRVLDRSEALAVISSCDTSTSTGIRDLAFLALAIDTGLRNSEICHLTLADLDLVNHSLAVIIKGGDEKTAVYSESTAHFLVNWIAARAPLARPTTQTLFCSTGGLTPGAPLTDGGLRCICRYIGRRAGLAKGFSPHALRRTMACLATRGGAPANVLMAMGRWRNEGMLKTYLADINAADGSRYSPISSLLDAKP